MLSIELILLFIRKVSNWKIWKNSLVSQYGIKFSESSVKYEEKNREIVLSEAGVRAQTSGVDDGMKRVD